MADAPKVQLVATAWKVMAGDKVLAEATRTDDGGFDVVRDGVWTHYASQEEAVKVLRRDAWLAAFQAFVAANGQADTTKVQVSAADLQRICDVLGIDASNVLTAVRASPADVAKVVSGRV